MPAAGTVDWNKYADKSGQVNWSDYADKQASPSSDAPFSKPSDTDFKAASDWPNTPAAASSTPPPNVQRALRWKERNRLIQAKPIFRDPREILGRPPQSVAEGLETEQEERSPAIDKGGGAPLVIPPEDGHASFVPRSTTRLSRTAQPASPAFDTWGGGRDLNSKATPLPYEGGTVWVPNDDSSEAQSSAAQNNAAEERGNLEAAKIITGAGGYPKIVAGLKKVLRSRLLEGGLAGPGLPVPVPNNTPVNKTEAASGVADITRGVGEASTPLVLAGGATAPIKTGLGFLAGYGASEGAGALVHGKVAPEYEDAIRQLAFWAPGLAGTLAGFHGTGIETPEVSTREVSGFGGKVGAGVARTSEGTTIRGKVGPFKAGFTIPNGTQASPGNVGLEAPTIEGQIVPPPPATPGEQALVNDQIIKARAANVVAGKPAVAPPPPPGPPPPPDVAQGHISPETVQGIGEALAKLPPNIRAQGMLEAHGTLSKVLLQQGKVVLPSGQIAVIDSPKSADKVATDLINAEVERQDELSKATKSADEKPAAVTSKNTPVSAAGEQTPRVTRKQRAAELNSQAPLRVVGVESVDESSGTSTPVGSTAQGGAESVQNATLGKREAITSPTTSKTPANELQPSTKTNQSQSAAERVPGNAIDEGTKTGVAAKASSQKLPNVQNTPANSTESNTGTLHVIGEEEAGVEPNEIGNVIRSAEQPETVAKRASQNGATNEKNISAISNAAFNGTVQPSAESQPARAFAKGDKVTLADGRSGTIEYIHPTMSIVRGHTDDGAKFSIGKSKLKHADVTAPSARVSAPSGIDLRAESKPTESGGVERSGVESGSVRSADGSVEGIRTVAPIHAEPIADKSEVARSAMGGQSVRLEPSTEETKVPERFHFISNDLGKVEKAYDKLGTPNYVAADKAKELLPEWADKAKRAGLEFPAHQASSELAYRLYRQKLARLKPGARVLFVTGPVAAGKSTAVKSGDLTNSDLTYEVNLSEYAAAKKRIDEVLAQGAQPKIYYVYTTPELSAERRALRAIHEHRPVNIERSTAQHLELPATIQRIADEYKGKVQIKIADNSKKGSPLVPIEKVGELAYPKGRDELLSDQQRLLDKLRDTKVIGEELHRQLSSTGSRSGSVGRTALESPASGEGSSGKGEAVAGVAQPNVKTPWQELLDRASEIQPDNVSALRRMSGEQLRSVIEGMSHVEPKPQPVPVTVEGMKRVSAAMETDSRPGFAIAQGRKIAERFRTVADRMDSKIDYARRSMDQNPTPKRMAQYRTRVIEADDMERTQKALRALADAHEAGKVPSELSNLRSNEDIARLVHKGLDSSRGGYYDRIPRQDYADKSAAGKKMQELLDKQTTETSASKEAKRKASEISQLEAQVQFQRLPGYFPTPKAVATRLVDEADIKPGMEVLEPSAGKGDIAEMIRQQIPDAKLGVVEQQSTLRKILELKGFNLVGSDFLEHRGKYDRVVMNPPFEQGTDVAHVRHAFELLKPGGKLVAVMSPHADFANDRKSADFRNWMESLDGTSEKLPEGSFKESGTGVASRMVVIDKPENIFTGESGSFEPGKLAEAAAEFYKQDVGGALEKAGIGIKDTAGLFVRAFYPRIAESNAIGRLLNVAAPTDAVDALMKLKGDREHAIANFDLLTKGMEKMFDRLPEESRIDFIDRLQTGQKQPTPELENIADLVRDIQQKQRTQEQTAANLGRPADKQIKLSEKENYFNNRWEKKPNNAPELFDEKDDEDKRIQQMFRPRRPLEGTRSYNKQQSYTLKSGMEAGGKPVTTNPIRVLRSRLEDGMKFVTARQAWQALDDLDLRQFVPTGKRAPEGFDKVDDRIAKVYFTAESGEGSIQAGEWYVEANTARLLNNMLSRDLIRGNAAGRGLLWLKNASTALELGLSPFHAVFETIEAASSQMALGQLKIYNQGIRQGDPAAFLSGLKDVLTSPIAPATMAREGSALPAYIEARARLNAIGITEFGHKQIEGKQPHGIMESLEHFHELRKQAGIQRLLKQYPDLDQLVDDMFTGGMNIGQHKDYQTKVLGKTVAEAWTEGNPIGAIFRAIPTANQAIMYPLFQWYIPSLKYSLFLRQMSQQAAERASELDAGILTRGELARQIVDSVENRFGELNFDNLFWNRTLKTALQFVFRSVTWKLGNTREFSGAIGGQSKALAEWSADAYHLLSGEKDGAESKYEKTKAEKALPRLDARGSWMFSLLFYTAAIGAIAGKVLSHKYPWEWSKEDVENFGEHKWEAAKSLYKEFVHPRTGDLDTRGKPVRVSLPTYLKDMEHLLTSPRQYVSGSFSSSLSAAIDLEKNKDYFGNYVYNPNAPIGTKLKQAGKYAFPTPFSVSNFERSKQQGETKTAWLSAFGFPRAPSDLDFTPAETLARDILKANKAPATPEQMEEWNAKREAYKKGELTSAEARGFVRRERESMLQRQVKDSGMAYSDAMRVYNAANAAEKQSLEPIMRAKRDRLMREHRGREIKDSAATQ